MMHPITTIASVIEAIKQFCDHNEVAIPSETLASFSHSLMDGFSDTWSPAPNPAFSGIRIHPYGNFGPLVEIIGDSPDGRLTAELDHLIVPFI